MQPFFRSARKEIKRLRELLVVHCVGYIQVAPLNLQPLPVHMPNQDGPWLHPLAGPLHSGDLYFRPADRDRRESNCKLSNPYAG